jgi:hypothetical protein
MFKKSLIGILIICLIAFSCNNSFAFDRDNLPADDVAINVWIQGGTAKYVVVDDFKKDQDPRYDFCGGAKDNSNCWT